jgi:hypothetical protein
MGGTGCKHEDGEPGRGRSADTEARTAKTATGFFDPRGLCHTAKLTPGA